MLLGLLSLVPIALNMLIRKKGMAWRLGKRDSTHGASEGIEAADVQMTGNETFTRSQSCADIAKSRP